MDIENLAQIINARRAVIQLFTNHVGKRRDRVHIGDPHTLVTEPIEVLQPFIGKVALRAHMVLSLHLSLARHRPVTGLLWPFTGLSLAFHWPVPEWRRTKSATIQPAGHCDALRAILTDCWMSNTPERGLMLA